MTQHPTRRLEDTVHQRVRLGILALLHDTERSHFTALRNALDIDDSALSRHLSVLEEAGYVEIEKGYEGKRPRTWVTLTVAGYNALEQELLNMRMLVHRFERASRERDPAIAAVFAFGALLGREAGEVGRVPSLRSVLLQTEDLPEGMEPIPPTGPINQYGEHPPRGDEPRQDTEEARRGRQLFIDAGLRGGYQRAWRNMRFDPARGGIPEHVHVVVYEWSDEETAQQKVDAYPVVGDHPVDVGDLDIHARALRYPGSPAFAGTRFAIGRLFCQVDVQGGSPDDHDAIVDLGSRLIRAQYERLRAHIGDE